MLVDTMIREKREEIYKIALNHGAKKIRVFGSVARGEEKSKSDIDLLVDFDEDRSLFDLIAFKNELEELLGRKVDVVTENSVHWYIKDKIIREAIEI